MSPRSRLCLALLAALLGPGARPAHAQVSEVAIARQLAIQGIDAVEAGDCKKGAPLLERAEQMHHASVHLQYLARCRAGEGHLVIATELWRQIIREGVPPGASQAVVAAITEATSSLERALPRLGTTTIRTRTDYPGLELSLDGTAIPREIVGASQAVDPGRHRLSARAPAFAEWTHEWTVPEGGSAEVVIDLVAREGRPEPKAAGHSARPGQPETAEGAFPLATLGWITASVGAISLVSGTVTWLTRNSRRSDLEANCRGPGGACGGAGSKYTSESQVEDDKRTIRTLTTVTNVLMFGGGTLLGGGVTLVVLGSGGRGEPQTAVLAGGPGACPGLTLRGHW